MEFKGTKGKWDVCEHSWSDTSILCEEKTICTQSIYDEATEENQVELETEMQYNFKLISKAPEMLEMLKELINLHDLSHETGQYDKARELIKEATEL